MKQVKDFPSKQLIEDDDLLLIQDAIDNAYKKCRKQDFLAGSFGGVSSQWQIKKSNYEAASGDKIIADCSTDWTLTLPANGVVDLIKITGNQLVLAEMNTFQSVRISEGIVKTNFEKVKLIYVNSTLGWIADKQNIIKTILVPAKHWRVSNTNIATGNDKQWICYEVTFKNLAGEVGS